METKPELFKDWLAMKRLKDRTIKEYLMYLEKLSVFNKINQETINLFLTAHNNIVARAFIKNYLYYLIKNKESLNLSQEQINDLKDIDPPKLTGRKRTRIPEVISINEVMEIEKACKTERDKLLLLINFYGGLRIDEAIHIKPYSFDWKLWKLDPTKPGHLKVIGKGDKERVVYVPPLIMQRLEIWIKNVAIKRSRDPNKPLFGLKSDRWRELIYEYSLKALNKRIHPHMLRHSCASWLYNKGWDLKKLQDYLGHESISSTQIYTHVNKKSIEDGFIMAID